MKEALNSVLAHLDVTPPVTQQPKHAATPAVLLIGADDQTLHKEFATLEEAFAYLCCEASEFTNAKENGLQVMHDGETWYTIAGSINDDPAASSQQQLQEESNPTCPNVCMCKPALD